MSAQIQELTTQRDKLKDQIESMNNNIVNHERLMEKSLCEINSLQVC